jgi:hypothetical protein
MILIHRLGTTHTIERDSHLLIRSSYVQIWGRVIAYETLMTLACGSLKIISSCQNPV